MRPSQALQRQADATATRDAPSLRRRARSVAGDLDNIVLKTLAKRPEQRYPSVEALALDLQRYLAGKPGAGAAAERRLSPAQVRPPPSLGAGDRRRWSARGAERRAGIVAWQARQAVQEASRAQALQDFVVGLFENAGDDAGRRTRSTCARCSTPASSAATANSRGSRSRAPNCSA